MTLQRKKSGLEFSVKGGTEHGIPLVVSWIKENGTAGEDSERGGSLLMYCTKILSTNYGTELSALFNGCEAPPSPTISIFKLLLHST